MIRKSLLFILGLQLCLVFVVHAQSKTETTILQETSKKHFEKERHNRDSAIELAKKKNWPLILHDKNGKFRGSLVGVTESGHPKYLVINDNIIAAATTKANELWPGGSTGLNLTGSSSSIKGMLAIWDGGAVLGTHQELTGRVLQKDLTTDYNDHATHVSGTMVASGVNPLAKGMAYQAQQLIAYDFNYDNSEMSAEAPYLLLSNHSYGDMAGWDNSTGNWEFLGNWGDTADYKFGYYSSDAQMWDSIAYNAPYYLIVNSAGNYRDSSEYGGPAIGQPYYRYNANNVMVSAGKRPVGISSNDGYESIPTRGCAKNILTVGAINGIPNGYVKPSDAVMSYFSSWGPTSDGRIKPDVVADGVNVLSCIATSDSSYDTYTGTSMAAPNATGTMYLLQQYYNNLHPGKFMRSATLKALVIHTADETGSSLGPDYQFGWGLVDAVQAAAVVTSNNTNDLIIEDSLQNAAPKTYTVIASGKEALRATIAWTDPIGTVGPEVLHDTTPRLVNDLDIRIIKGSNTYFPWVLNPDNPSLPATKGDNFRDNVERIDMDSVAPGDTYTIRITHKGTLARGSQYYSLIISGVGGSAYCTSSSTSNTGTKIDSVSFANINNKNTNGCVGYSNYKNQIAQVNATQVVPLSVVFKNCAPSSPASKMVKVYIDFNNNGSFTDSGELVAASGVISNDTFKANITIPSNIVVGNYSVMRIVAEETTDSSTILPCGNYGTGETEDYTLQYITPANDIAITNIVTPFNNECASSAQYITVKIMNEGTASNSNIPISAVVKNGSQTVSTPSSVYPGTIAALSGVTYTLQTPFNSVAGNTYTITVTANLSTDQYTLNNSKTITATIADEPSAPVATAQVYNDTGYLKITTPDSSLPYLWYSSSIATDPFAEGSNITTSIIPDSKIYFVNSGLNGNVGVASKNDYPVYGNYQQGGYNIKYSSTHPVILETARLFTRGNGTATISVADASDTLGRIVSNVIGYVPLDIYPTNPNYLTDATNVNDPADTGAVFYIGLPLPGGNHIITVSASDSLIFRTNSIATNGYPYTLDKTFSITGNSNYTPSSPTNYQYFYYYLYDMNISSTGCISSLASVVAPNTDNYDMSVYPNPVQNNINLSVYIPTATTAVITIYSIDGKRYYTASYPSSSGAFYKSIDVSTFPSGIYIIKLDAGGNSYTKKIVITR